MGSFQPLAVLLLLAWTAWGSSLGPCDPIDPARCGLPFPNNFWLRPHPLTGALRLNFSLETLPVDDNNKPIDPVTGGWNDLDGFSPAAPIVTYFPNVSLDNLPHYWDVAASLTADCPSVLLDTVTGEILPHFVELDHSSDNDTSVASEPLLMLWSTKALQFNRRYIIAYRELKDQNSGELISPSSAFQALRDDTPTTDYDIESRRALFNDIFARLEKVGFARSSLQIAWDFSVGSRSSMTDRMLLMRDDATARIHAAGGISYKIVNFTDNYSSQIARLIEGIMYIPQYVNSQLPGATLVLDANGNPVYQGMGEVTFTALIPSSLVTPGSGVNASFLQYGHGLFGAQTECKSGYLQVEAEKYGYVIAAVDWLGMAELDAVSIALMMATDITGFRMIPDRSSQGMLHQLMLAKLFSQMNFLSDPVMNPNGVRVLAPNSPKYYTGNSQGGILGSVLLALSQDIPRGVLGVYGGPYSLLLPRSGDFDTLFNVLKSRYHNAIDRVHLINFMQLLWDRAEPAAYMSSITSNPLPNTPVHQALFQHALGDRQVTYLGAYFLARSASAVMFESNVHEPNETLWGFEFIPDTASANNAIVTWDFPGIPPVPEINIPPAKSAGDTHEYVRRQTTAQSMMYTFFTTGKIVNTCGGPCHGIIP